MAKYTHKTGEVLDVQQITHVSGINGDTGTRITYRCRIRWSDGKEAFAELRGNYSPGHKIMMIYNRREPVEEHNLTIPGAWPALRPGSLVDGVMVQFIVILSFVVVFMFGIGAAMLLMGGDGEMGMMLIAGSIALCFFVFLFSKQRASGLKAYRAKALASAG